MHRLHVKQLEQFQRRALHSILGIRWQDEITKLEVLERAETTSIETVLKGSASLDITRHQDGRTPHRHADSFMESYSVRQVKT